MVELTSEIKVEYIDGYGGDWLICDAARVSNKHSAGSGPRELTPADIGLIKSLVRQRHGGPFGHGGLTFYVEAPIFVFREWRTHRVAMVQSTDDFSYSEASARYRPLEMKFYLPPLNRPLMLRPGHKAMKPVYDVATKEQYGAVLAMLNDAYTQAAIRYHDLLDFGVAPEIARAVLGTGVYSAMYVSCNPRSLMHFLSLRVHDDNATFESFPQWEIEEAAVTAERMFAMGWPETRLAFAELGRVGP